ncbi:MAG: alpha/beta fold hydrolase [Rhodospirillaceae bacterium]|nr:alpha/beta fold hydrolase [Rhodospirillaceae bacterium]
MPTTVRRAIVDTPEGQVHVRVAGLGEPLVLLHWTPGSGRQYAALLPEMAARGYRAIAPDHMGHGFSDARKHAWTVGDFAENIAHVMTCLGLKDANVIGGHFSSEIATELALRHPTRVKKLVLDGSPVWSREMREKVMATARPTPPRWSEAGDHVAWSWQRALWLQRMWDSQFTLNDTTAGHIKAAMIDALLAGQQDDTAEALKDYDMDAALKKLALPTLAIAAETDPLTNCHADVLSRVPSARGYRFAGSHPLHHVDRAADYARVIHAFFSGSAPDLFHDHTAAAPKGASYGVH